MFDDVYGTNPDGSPSLDLNGERRLMTDGHGLLALNLACLVPPVIGGLQARWGSRLPERLEVDEAGEQKAPLGTQMRLFCQGSVSKGVLQTHALLPSGLIVLLRSQVKVQPSAECAAARNGFCRFEVCQTSEKAVCARLNHFLVPSLGCTRVALNQGGSALWDQSHRMPF